MTKMDELSPYSEGLVLTSSASDKPVEKTIDGLLDECTRDLLLSHPLQYLDADTASPVVHGDTVTGLGWLELPADFLRLVVFKMTGWQREVNHLISTSDPLYRLQSNEFTRGGKSKPVAVRTTKYLVSVMDAIEYYSLVPGDVHTIDTFLYIKNIVAEALRDDLIADGLSWIAASKALSSLGHTTESDNALKFVKSFNSR